MRGIVEFGCACGQDEIQSSPRQENRNDRVCQMLGRSAMAKLRRWARKTIPAPGGLDGSDGHRDHREGEPIAGSVAKVGSTWSTLGWDGATAG